MYAEGSNDMIKRTKIMWIEYCAMTKNYWIAALELFQVKVVSTFFYWLLRTRQSTLRKASTVQTYWNTLCLVRKAETGKHIITVTPNTLFVTKRVIFYIILQHSSSIVYPLYHQPQHCAGGDAIA
jgi:hypothetical protein